MNSWKVILATMLIFGAGVVTGGLLVRHAVRSQVHAQRSPAQRTQQNVSPGLMRVEFLRRAQRDLDLSVEQRAQVDDILKRSQERSRKLMEPIAPRLREEVQKTREEFRQVLTAEQRTQFDAMWKQRPRESRPGKDRPSLRTNAPPAS